MSPVYAILAPLAFLALVGSGDAPQDPRLKKHTNKPGGVIVWQVGQPRQNGEDVFVVTLFDPLSEDGKRDVTIPVPDIGRTMRPERKAQHLKEAIEREAGSDLEPHQAGHMLLVKAKHPNKGVLRIKLDKNGSRQKDQRRGISTPTTGPRMSEIPGQTTGAAEPLVIDQVGRFSLTGLIPSCAGYVVQLGVDDTVVQVDPSAYVSVPHLLFDLSRQLKQRGLHADLVRTAHGLEIVVLLTPDDSQLYVGSDSPTLLSSDSVELWND